jgi:hypothetical protein
VKRFILNLILCAALLAACYCSQQHAQDDIVFHCMRSLINEMYDAGYKRL